MIKFRTEIEPLRNCRPIAHDEPLLLLGSCFTDEIGSHLVTDGFNAVANPMGSLYNPASISRVINRALSNRPYTLNDLTEHEGIFHCLDFPSRYQSKDADKLLETVNDEFTLLSAAINHATTWIITFGTSRVFTINNGNIVGNCHKLPTSKFTERYLSISEIVELWSPLLQNRRIIFTVSPIRHLNDGLHFNQLSKSRLLLAVEQLCNLGTEYFPAYEIMLDDLRDYRFYDSDLKHPSPVAIDYIYDIFGKSYFTETTRILAAESRRESVRAAHRPIISL